MAPLASLRRIAAGAALAALTAALGWGCRPPRPEPPPAAEFLVAAGDSTFWVRTVDGRINVRRAPLTLASVDGRFHELFVADDDRSYYDALFVNQRVYRRDLLSGDSLAVFEDHRVPELARAYAASNPDERPLEPHEEGSDDPHAVATAETQLLEALGPYLSLEYRIDIDIANGEDSHLIRRAVVDLRDGRAVALHDVVGDSAAARLVASGRREYRTLADSVRRVRGHDHRAARAFRGLRFDAGSFAIGEIDGAPAVTFLVPGRGPDADGLVLPLAPLRVPVPDWWAQVQPTIPRVDDDSVSDVWRGASYDVVARYDSAGESATLVIRDSARREWPATRLPAPARRLYRLDQPAVDTAARKALARAFDESVLYSANARTVVNPRPGRSGGVVRWALSHLTVEPLRGEHSNRRGSSLTLGAHTPLSMPSYRAPDGTVWGVDVRLPGASNAMIVFRHPDDSSTRRNRYAWLIWHGPEAHDVTARVKREKVLQSITDADIARLFRRSMPISADRGMVGQAG